MGLRQLKIDYVVDKRQYVPNETLTFFDDFKDECQVALLFNSQLPLRLGDLLGPRPQLPAGQVRPGSAPKHRFNSAKLGHAPRTRPNSVGSSRIHDISWEES